MYIKNVGKYFLYIAIDFDLLINGWKIKINMFLFSLYLFVLGHVLQFKTLV